MTLIDDASTPPQWPQIVETPERLHDLVQRLLQHPQVAVDTESNSLHAYRERVCLIQFSVPGEDWVVDPLALHDLQPLMALFAAPEVEKVFHAMEYDLSVLQRDYGFCFKNIFDTMWSARILGWPRVGLGDILTERFGISPNKRYQRYDWGRRPLAPEALAYAAMDTRYLLPLSALQRQELEEKGRWEEAQEIFTYLVCHVPHPVLNDQENTFWRIKGVYDLNATEQAFLYRLHCWREATAERLDRPAFKVISDGLLVTLARVQPRTSHGLLAAGLTVPQVRHFGQGILRALRAGPLPVPALPENERPPEDVAERYQALRVWRKELAAQRGVESDVILPNATLWEIARHPPQNLDDLLNVPGIGPWRQRTYGPAILALLTYHR